MATVTICSDLGAQENKVSYCFQRFHFYLSWNDGTRYHDFHFFECWILSQLFHSPLSLWLTPVLWPPHAKSWLIGKDFDAGRDWGQEEKWTTEDEMARWHHGLDGRDSEWTPGDGWTGRPGVLWFMGLQRVGHDWDSELNWTELNWTWLPIPHSSPLW